MKGSVLFFVLLFIINVCIGQSLKKTKEGLPLFKAYKVDNLYSGKVAKIDLNSNPKMKLFRTAIRNGYSKNRLNFAGHYCLVHWGCGSECQQSIIIDLITGKVYDGIDASLGYKFKANSKMLVVNPPNVNGEIDDFCMGCYPRIWVLNEKTKKFYNKKIENTSPYKEVN